MSNYYSHSRSNYFQVKDAVSFKKEIEEFGNIDICEQTDESGVTRYCLLMQNLEQFPSWKIDKNTGDEEECESIEIVARHLIDGEVAIFTEVGYEKLCYVAGTSVAINNKLEKRVIALEDIYKLAKELTSTPENITQAVY